MIYFIVLVVIIIFLYQARKIKKQDGKELLRAENEVRASFEKFRKVSGIKLDATGNLVLDKNGNPAPRNNATVVKKVLDGCHGLGGDDSNPEKIEVQKLMLGEKYEIYRKLSNQYDEWENEENVFVKNRLEREMSVTLETFVV